MRRVLRPPDLPPAVGLGSMPVWHNPLFRDEKGLTYHSPNLIRRDVRCWEQLADEGAIPKHLLSIVAPTWHARYAAKAAEYYSILQARSDPPVPEVQPAQGKGGWGERKADLAGWSGGWGKQRILLQVAQAEKAEARQPLGVWRAFRQLRLPDHDRYLVKNTMEKNASGITAGKGPISEPLWLLDGRVECHEHVFCPCKFVPFFFETVRRCFWGLRHRQGAGNGA